MEEDTEEQTKWLIGCFMTIVLWSLPSVAQEKNEVGLVIGGIVTPSQTLSPDANLIGPAATPLPDRDIAFEAGYKYSEPYCLGPGLIPVRLSMF